MIHRILTIALSTAAVLWGLYSLQAVARFGGAVILDPATTGRIMAVRNVTPPTDTTPGSQTIHSAVGLTYHGLPGAILAAAQILLVAAAIAALCMRHRVIAAAGAALLAAWAGLWLWNTLRLNDFGLNRPADPWLLSLALAASLLSATLRLIGSAKSETVASKPA